MDKWGRRGMLGDGVAQPTRFDLPMLLSERNYWSCDARAARACRGGEGAWPFMPTKRAEVVLPSASPRRVLAGAALRSRRTRARTAGGTAGARGGAASRPGSSSGVAGACARALRAASRVVTLLCGQRALRRAAERRMGGARASAGSWLKVGRRARSFRAGGSRAASGHSSGGVGAPGAFRTGGPSAPVGSKNPDGRLPALR